MDEDRETRQRVLNPPGIDEDQQVSRVLKSDPSFIDDTAQNQAPSDPSFIDEAAVSHPPRGIEPLSEPPKSQAPLPVNRAFPPQPNQRLARGNRPDENVVIGDPNTFEVPVPPHALSSFN